MSAVRSLTGVNRTWRGQPNSVEIDPNRTIPLADFALGRLGCRRRARLRLEPEHFLA